MGEAKRRGTRAERVRQAIMAGRFKRPRERKYKPQTTMAFRAAVGAIFRVFKRAKPMP